MCLTSPWLGMVMSLNCPEGLVVGLTSLIELEVTKYASLSHFV
jgi:hypothetical protein